MLLLLDGKPLLFLKLFSVNNLNQIYLEYTKLLIKRNLVILNIIYIYILLKNRSYLKKYTFRLIYEKVLQHKTPISPSNMIFPHNVAVEMFKCGCE